MTRATHIHTSVIIVCYLVSFPVFLFFSSSTTANSNTPHIGARQVHLPNALFKRRYAITRVLRRRYRRFSRRYSIRFFPECLPTHRITCITNVYVYTCTDARLAALFYTRAHHRSVSVCHGSFFARMSCLTGQSIFARFLSIYAKPRGTLRATVKSMQR